MLDSNFWIYQEDGGWNIEVYDVHTDEYKGTVECSNLVEVTTALLDVSEEATDLHLDLGEN